MIKGLRGSFTDELKLQAVKYAKLATGATNEQNNL